MSPRFGGRRAETPGERSTAEREAARIERERRRAAREGRPLPDGSAGPDPEPPPAEPVDVAPAPADPPMPAPDPSLPEYDEPSAPIDDEPPALYDQPVYAEAAHESGVAPRYEPEPVYEPEPLHEPEAVYAPEPIDEPGPAFEPVDEPEPVALPAGGEAPAGVRRVAAPSVRDLPEVAGPRPTAPVRARGVPRGRRGRRVVPVLVLLALLAAGVFAVKLFQPFAGDGDAARPVRVTIPQGATAADVGKLLAQRGVVDSAFFFGLRARLEGRRGDLKAGSFTLRRDMSYVAALDALTRNPAAPRVLRVTVPEGRSIGEAAPLVRSGGLRGAYVRAATRNPRTIKALKRYGVPRGTRTLEGFLFPATYELRRGATARQLVDQQLRAFRATFDKLDLRAARRKNLTPYDVLIIASMIEREAGVAKDRRLIAAVVYNRLKQHIPLGIDATLRYHLKNWSRPLRQSELAADSAFNTRLRQGLPPTPIGSPGAASIRAALAPAKVPYLYYVVRPCGNGAHAFSASDAQFQKDVAAYNRKRAQLGGKDPSHC